MEICPNCSRPYGKRRRCYHCSPGKKKTGQVIKCLQCGKERYIEKNQLERGEGKFCSYECKYEWDRGRPIHFRRENETTEHSSGYLRIWVGYDHPYNQYGRILEHRYVMEQHLGRYLEPHEVIHHINGNKQDNRLENLQLMTNADHAKLHMKGRPKKK